MPRVSVIIPTFNCARFLGRALESAFAQTFKDYEVIIADDGSTDNTRDLVARYSGKVSYLYQPNTGPSAARNLALSKASGEFLAYLDADDIWYPRKLETQVAFMDVHQECGVVHSDFTTIDETDRVIRRRFNHEPPREIPQGACLMDLLRRCHIQISTVVERHDCLQKIGGFDERLKGVEDYARWVQLAVEGYAVGYIDDALAMYRKSSGSLGSNERGMCEAFVTMFRILLEEKSLALRCGPKAAEIAHAHLYALQRDLAYLERMDGQTAQARRLLVKLIREWPLRTELFLDLLKTAVSPVMAAKLRRLRAQGRGKEGGRS